MTTFTTASVCVVRDGALLTVRKRGTARFMLPGGKLEHGESPVDCAVREAAEEIGLVLVAAELTELGDWTAPAANEPGALVQSTVFVAPGGPVAPRPMGEIEELRWQPLGERSDDLAPLLVEHVLPALEALDSLAR
jgi:8-oxo-dGTP pyrophosphatase MutT (NUDIX family)